jgi:hypothetical protein
VVFQDAPHHGQADACAVRPRGEEVLEDAGPDVVGHPRPFIVDRERNLPFALLDPDRHGRTGGARLERIAHEVP